MSNVDFILLFGAVVGSFVVITILRRHQRSHCAHIHELSLAVVAIAETLDLALPGELPADLREFVTWYKNEDNEDRFLEEDKPTVDAD